MSFTRSGICLDAEQPLDREAEGERVGLRAEVVHPLDQRDHLLPLLLLGGLLDAGVEEADGRVRLDDGLAGELTTRFSTPCVLGCCGPMLTVIVSRAEFRHG